MLFYENNALACITFRLLKHAIRFLSRGVSTLEQSKAWSCANLLLLLFPELMIMQERSKLLKSAIKEAPPEGFVCGPPGSAVNYGFFLLCPLKQM